MRHCKIYAICHPDTREVVYVGQTILPLKSRLSQHLSSRSNISKYNWVKSLQSLNKSPVIILLEDCNLEANSYEREQFWINHFKIINNNLLNLSSGRPKIEKPLTTRTFKLDEEDFNLAVEMYGSKYVTNEIRKEIKRLANCLPSEA